jgi:hypothetical protein
MNMDNFVYSEIFGEAPETLAKRETEQRELERLSYAIDKYLEKGELGAILQRSGSTSAIDVRKLQSDLGIESEAQPVSDTFTKTLDRPLLVDDRLGRAACKLIAKEVGKLRRTATGSAVSIEAGLREAWNQFEEYANPQQKTLAAQAIRQSDSPVVQALLREAMQASEVSL